MIYGEYLFLENALAGLGLLVLTQRFCGMKARLWRLAVGSCLCGLYSFTLFWQTLPLWGGALMKAGFSVGLILLVFGSDIRGVRQGGKVLFLFYIISLGAGGIAMGVLYFTGAPGVAALGGLYAADPTYLHIALGMGLAWWGLSSMGRLFRGRLLRQRTQADLEICVEDRKVLLKGLVDTGNFLRDPLSGKPVLLAEEGAFQELFPRGIPANRLRLIPYQAVGTAEGLLTGALPDAVILRTGPPRRLPGVVVARYGGAFPTGWDQGRYSILLHPGILEGGLFCDA